MAQLRLSNWSGSVKIFGVIRWRRGISKAAELIASKAPAGQVESMERV